MIKKLLIGASALALTTTVAHAQSVANPANLQARDDYGTVINGAQFDAAVEAANNELNNGSGSTTQKNAAIGTALNAGDTEYVSPIGNTPYRGLTGLYEKDALASTSLLNRQGAGNESGVEQDGDKNEARVDQTAGNGGWSLVNQRGDENEATVKQTDSTSAGQTAALNRAYIGQISAAGQAAADAQKATITQTFVGTGTHNAAVIIQGVQVGSALTTQPGKKNTAAITQTGNGQDAIIEQGADWDGPGDFSGGNNAWVKQSQTGYAVGNNRAVIQQENGADATVEQIGSGNRAYVQQDAGNTGNKSYSWQQGENNFAAVSQDANSTSYLDQDGTGNQAFVRQNGANALSELSQKGELNFASVLQTATNTVSHLTQDGNFNNAFISQATFGSRAVTHQDGNSNLAIVRQ